ncbi:sulfite exporter TauE/SafE family protein [Maribellus sp. CM-23]|uniref:aromatic aminobenezylarsenical efflux permease ArsG family transporter n=1 Tax=Maribellus sp. CM-23 TaxID=2781026 RepID=UPI001F25AB21|nr:aromatic aminobenezylarsenical efflux permease ArsG family transporter [Maribellus sp. CM-23]MCE4564498.1 sulfite exporter TauE/SafE family protein [Maribellus sp. CM-23]
MEGLLTELLENSSFPVVTALVLGLMTAISPCPLATNITAVGFIGKDIENRNRVFYNGLIYTLGRAIAYTLLAFVIFLGADQFEVSGVFQRYGMKIIGPLLIVIGLFMLGVLKISLPGGGKIAERFEKKGVTGYWDVLLLGMLFAMAFCPYSGVLYFGMLIPLTISSASGLYLPVVFAIATGIPVILFAWLIAYAVSGVGGLYQRLKTFEYWFRKVIAVLFILVGLYYIITVFF